jgi:hypothetical protein
VHEMLISLQLDGQTLLFAPERVYRMNCISMAAC